MNERACHYIVREITCRKCGKVTKRAGNATLCMDRSIGRPQSARSLLKDANSILRRVTDPVLADQIKAHLAECESFGRHGI